MMSEEASSRTTSANTSTQSTPTPPNGRRGRRLRKCATPIKSAEKVEQHEKVRVRQGPPTLLIPSSTNSSASDITPSSSGATTPAKVEGESGKLPITPLRPPLPSPTMSTSSSPSVNIIKKRKRIPYTLVEASKGNKCPTPSCNGIGHVTGLYSMHYAESGCPIAAQKKKELEKSQGLSGSSKSKSFLKRPPGRRKKRRRRSNLMTVIQKKVPDLVNVVTKEKQSRESSTESDIEIDPVSSPVQIDVEGTSSSLVTEMSTMMTIDDTVDVEGLLPSVSSPDLMRKRKRIPYTLVEANKGNKCPTVGCNGIGHITGLYAMHYAVSGCPLAHGKTPGECKARRDEINRVRLQTISHNTTESLENLTPPPRKTPRVQATRNLSLSLENVTGATPTSTPKHSRVSHPQATPTPRVPEYYYKPEPNLEGIAPTQDLLLFREAQVKMKEQLCIDPGKKEYRLSKVKFGSYEIKTWCTSPYSPEYTQLTQIYICEFCLRYFRSLGTSERHEKSCTRRRPPGREIYRKCNYSVFEVDGEDHKEYCQNLCLLAKLFLDHKTLYFDVEPFLFYVLTECDKVGCHLLGYFSKEKHSSQGYNVSCILTMPQHMKKGYGKMLIDFSYLLTRLEEKVGSPERPLSDLGLLSYRSYWKYVILTYLVKNNSRSGSISIKEMSQETGVTSDDLISTLQYFGFLKYWKGKHIIIKKKDILEEHTRKLEERKDSPVTLEPSLLMWSPTEYPTYP